MIVLRLPDRREENASLSFIRGGQTQMVDIDQSQERRLVDTVKDVMGVKPKWFVVSVWGVWRGQRVGLNRVLWPDEVEPASLAVVLPYQVRELQRAMVRRGVPIEQMHWESFAH